MHHRAVEHLRVLLKEIPEHFRRRLFRCIFLPPELGGDLIVQLRFRQTQVVHDPVERRSFFLHLLLDLLYLGIHFLGVNSNLETRQVLVEKGVVDQELEDLSPCLGLHGRRHAPESALHGYFGDGLAVDRGGNLTGVDRRHRCGGRAVSLGQSGRPGNTEKSDGQARNQSDAHRLFSSGENRRSGELNGNGQPGQERTVQHLTPGRAILAALQAPRRDRFGDECADGLQIRPAQGARSRSCLISRTARSIPTSTARDTMLWPMFNSSTPAIWVIAWTFV